MRKEEESSKEKNILFLNLFDLFLSGEPKILNLLLERTYYLYLLFSLTLLSSSFTVSSCIFVILASNPLLSAQLEAAFCFPKSCHRWHPAEELSEPAVLRT